MYRYSKSFLLVLVLSIPAMSSELSVDEQEVWELEVKYWEYVKNNDISSYRALWDERFIGWPGFSRSPMSKARIHDWFAPYHEDPSRNFDYELDMESVRSYGPDIVVAHYLAHGKFNSTETGEELSGGYVSRITHTWQRRENSWVIITGMSGDWVGSQSE